jgi:spore maturation protein CgeB
MKVLYVGYRHEFGDSLNGDAINYLGWFMGFVNLGFSVDGVFFDKKSKEEIQTEINNKLKNSKPDVVFVIPQLDKLPPNSLNNLINTKDSKFVGFFGDDQWRFKNFSKKYAKLFDLIVTTDFICLDLYKDHGAKSAILSQWAAVSELCNSLDGTPLNDFKYDITFVGACSRYRKWFIDRLAKDGIVVECFGDGWKNDRVSFEQMSEIARQSKISLNISNSISFDIRFIFSSISNFLAFIKNQIKSVAKDRSQMKARNFEISGFGGFQLTDYVPGLDMHWIIGKDIACYSNYDECLLMIHYWLTNNKKREDIRISGNKKAISHHTYEVRIKKILEKID